jgi:DNA-binding LytR/AlgR family response regulator
MHFSIPPVEKRNNTFIPINSLLDSTDTRPSEHATLIYIRDIEGVSHAVHPGAVVYLEAAHQYVDVHLLRETFRTRSSLSAMLDRLPATFVRVHRSFAINAKLVTSMSSSKITMSNGEQIYVPVKRRTAVRKQLREAMEVNPYSDAPAAHVQVAEEPAVSETTSPASQL